MKKQVITAMAAASMLLAMAPAAMAQNVAIVNGKAVDEYFAAAGHRPFMHPIDFSGRIFVKTR